MDPHRILAFLWNQAGVDLPQNLVREYWTKSRENREPWAMASSTVDHVPLGVYGDSATLRTKFGMQTAVIGLFVSLPLWRPKSIRMSRYLVLAIPEQCCWKHHTLQHALRRITWSLNSLWVNRHPSTGPSGEDLPPHMESLANSPIVRPHCIFQVTEIRGDWSWHKKVWACKASWVGKCVCFQCGAQSDGPFAERYYNWQTATWLNRMYSPAQFISQQLPETGI